MGLSIRTQELNWHGTTRDGTIARHHCVGKSASASRLGETRQHSAGHYIVIVIGETASRQGNIHPVKGLHLGILTDMVHLTLMPIKAVLFT